jgi:hypothetical protein
LAYPAFTVYGGPFQNLLLASEISYLVQTLVELAVSTEYWSEVSVITDFLDSSRAPHWLITCHNPLFIFAYQLIHLNK